MMAAGACIVALCNDASIAQGHDAYASLKGLSRFRPAGEIAG